MRRHFLAAVVLVFAGGAVAQAPAMPGVVVEYQVRDRLVAVEGIVEAVRQSTLAAQVAGRVVTLAVKAGDRIRAGQLLVQIDPRTAVQAEIASQSVVREAQANLVNAKAKYDRSRQLYEQKFISRAALDQAENDYLAAQAQAAGASANAGQAATSKSYTTIVAPYDGIVASTDVEVGEMATAGRPLVTVFDPRELRVTLTLPQALLAQANLNAPVKVEVPTLERTLPARRVTVIPVADTRTHTTHVRIDLPEATGLMPGQFARAQIVAGRVGALSVPRTAVLRRSEVTAVYVLDAKGNAQLRQVRLGQMLGDDQVEVLAGLEAGERVATEPVRAGIEASGGTARRS